MTSSDIHFTQEFKEHLNIMFVQLNADYKTFSLYLFYMVGKKINDDFVAIIKQKGTSLILKASNLNEISIRNF